MILIETLQMPNALLARSMLLSKPPSLHTIVVTACPSAPETHTCNKNTQGPTPHPANANLFKLNIGFRGEQSLSASLSGTSKSSLPFNDERLRLCGVTMGGGELAATTTSDSMTAQAESSISGSLTTGGGVPGTIGSGIAFKDWSSGDGEGAHTSVLRRRMGDFAARVVRPQRGGGGLYMNLDRSSSIWEEIAVLKTESGSGLPNELAGVSVPVVSCDCPVLLLEVDVDCELLLELD
jgi:hypothetical protein